jgi:RND family efflux transporter MFP subunit
VTEFSDPLLKLAPAERMQLLQKFVDKDKDFAAPTRGPLTEALVERGNLDAAQATNVICGVRSVIKWVIDDGVRVKKGDKLLELDTSLLEALLKTQKDAVARSEAERKRAADEADRVRAEVGVEVKIAQLDAKLADLALRQYMGKDATQREILATQADRASLVVDKIKLQGMRKEESARETLAARKTDHERAQARLAELEKGIASYVVTAPHDGIVAYYVPEQDRFGGGQPQALVAQGEPVREGQKLLRLSDLSRILVVTHVHEAAIHKVRAGQKATIRVDAFPNLTFTGKVQDIATVASAPHFFAKDVKVYRVTALFDGENKGLKPGMSAVAEIVLADEANCLRLPASAVLGKGADTYCYVLSGKELQMHKITIGASDGKLVEVRAGLKEGEPVLLNPHRAFKDLKGK